MFTENKSSERISKQMFQGNKAPQISRKNEHFLPPDTHTYVSLPLLVITDEMSDIMSVYGKTFFLVFQEDLYFPP